MIRAFQSIFLLCLLAVAASTGSAADLTVAADGSGDVRTVQAAIDRVPKSNSKRFVIAIKPGKYIEQVRVAADRPYVSLIGSDAALTTLSFSLSNKEAGSTSAAYATYIGGHDFYAENITFENSFGQGSQAVAVIAEADRVVFKRCRFLAWQDTLYAKNGRQFYVDCYIEGSVDFIFGQAAAVFENCEISSKTDGYIAAPMRFSAAESAGFVFSNCRLTAQNDQLKVYLGRPWRDYGRTVFLSTEMASHIRPEGWHHWLPEREKTAYFAEFRSKGPGGVPSTRVKWSHQLTAEEAKAFAAKNFLKGDDGWDPTTAGQPKFDRKPPTWRLVTWDRVFKQIPLWYQTDEAARVADQLLLYQKENGGFEKNIDMTLILTQREKAKLTDDSKNVTETTIDNRTTYPQVAYLGKIITASLLKSSTPNNFPKYKEAFNKGLDYLLASQYENGGFPQFFPLKAGYYSHITLNDDAMIGTLELLRDIASKESDYTFVDEERRVKAAMAVKKGVDLILKLQVENGGVKTVWAAQYDEFSLLPAKARAFEPASLTAGESVAVVKFLMREPTQTAAIKASVESAIGWFKANRIDGIRWERRNGDNVVIKDKNAGPMWARFYQLETMKPIFIGRDSIIKFDVSEIEAERRNGYAWYVSAPNELLEKDYPKWKAAVAK